MYENKYELVSISERTITEKERHVLIFSKDGKFVLSGWLKESTRMKDDQ